jgi:RNA polymerase sigma-70 factor (ECF subfamily)
LRDQAAAEDVVQDCYLRLLERAGRYDLPCDGIKILLRAVTNASIDRRSRERTLLSLDGGEEGGSDLADRRSPCPVQEAIGSELAARIEAALERLPVGQRAAVHLSGLGYTLPEVAEMLETSHANARVLVHRARRALEEVLGPFLYGGEP